MIRKTIFAALALLLGSQYPCSAQVTFQVCAVKKATSPLPQVDYATAIHQMSASFLFQPKKSLEGYARRRDSLVASYYHPFVYAAQMAYAQHRPLRLSPDMIWMLMAQGFARHVDLNAEKLRSYFVDFQGKRQIDVEMNSFEKGSDRNDWESLFPQFQEKIGRYTGKELGDLIDARFSTSSPVEQNAFRISLMDAMSDYFEYSVTVLCGIPEITLEGTPEDWELLEQKNRELGKYDLDWWTNALAPILHQFTEASKGRADAAFWDDFYKVRVVDLVCTEGEELNGWLIKFFPYIGKERNPVFETPDFSISPSALGDGPAKVDFLLNDLGKMYQMEFVSGFVGVAQDPATLALRPEISWAVFDTGEQPDKKKTERYNKHKQAQNHAQASRN